MIAAAVLVAGGGFPTPSAVSGSAGDEPRVNSGELTRGLTPPDVWAQAPARLVLD